MRIPFPWFVFDVESVGLFGQGFAVGYVVIGENGKELSSSWYGVPLDKAVSYYQTPDNIDGYNWCLRNIPSEVLEGNTDLPTMYQTFTKLLETAIKKNYSIIADCPFPVEANFLLDVQKHNPDAFVSPYPLYDVASILAGLGRNPLELYERKENEPLHHPLGDARQSARILYEEYINYLNNKYSDE